jgi:hypothetical protein
MNPQADEGLARLGLMRMQPSIAESRLLVLVERNWLPVGILAVSWPPQRLRSYKLQNVSD